MAAVVLVVNVLSTAYMVGLIWLIQIVHYPLFSEVGKETFATYERKHTSWITPVVGIPMLMELGTAVWLVYKQPQLNISAWSCWLGLAMVVAVWVITAICSVPCHNRLSDGFDATAHRRLVMTNWLRTFLWSGRGVLGGWWLVDNLTL